MASLAAALWWVGCGQRFDPGDPSTSIGGSGAATSSSTSTGGTGGTGAGGAGAGATGAGSTGGQGGHDGVPCHPTGLQDGFEAIHISPLWAPWGVSGAAGVGGGVAYVQLQAPDDQGYYAGLTTAEYYDVRGCAVWIEVIQAFATTVPGEVYFGVWAETAKTGLACRAQLGVFRCWSELPAGEQESWSAPYDTTEHRWWRIRDTGTSTLFETSADGRGYEVRLTIASPYYLGAVKVGFGAGLHDMTTSLSRAEFDNVNLLPPVAEQR